jgi:hypothetical protein
MAALLYSNHSTPHPLQSKLMYIIQAFMCFESRLYLIPQIYDLYVRSIINPTIRPAPMLFSGSIISLFFTNMPFTIVRLALFKIPFTPTLIRSTPASTARGLITNILMSEQKFFFSCVFFFNLIITFFYCNIPLLRHTLAGTPDFNPAVFDLHTRTAPSSMTSDRLINIILPQVFTSLLFLKLNVLTFIKIIRFTGLKTFILYTLYNLQDLFLIRIQTLPSMHALKHHNLNLRTSQMDRYNLLFYLLKIIIFLKLPAFSSYYFVRGRKISPKFFFFTPIRPLLFIGYLHYRILKRGALRPLFIYVTATPKIVSASLQTGPVFLEVCLHTIRQTLSHKNTSELIPVTTLT